MRTVLIILLALVAVPSCNDSEMLPTGTSPSMDLAAAGGSTSLGLPVSQDPRACEDIDFFRARVEVAGKRVEVTTRLRGIAFHGTVGRMVFWPNGRHTEPQFVSDLFETGRDDDFPAEVTFNYRFPNDTPSGEILSHLDYEMLLKCYDATTERFVLGWFDEYGFCREGKHIILQCDRGVSYRIE